MNNGLGSSCRGWVPSAISFDRQPHIIQEALVNWVELGSEPMAEPFFDHTISRLRNATPAVREILTDMDTLFRFGALFPRAEPTGFIFHISRCGSTLLANALKTAHQALVVSEPRPVTDTLLLRSPSGGPYLLAPWERMQHRMVESMFSIFANYRADEPEKLVIKFTSINILAMRQVRTWWPDVPCVVVVRDPAEVMVAYEQGGGWMYWKDSPESWGFLGATGWPCYPNEMTDEEYSARVLGRYFQSALDAFDEKKCLVVDYQDLRPGRIREIAGFLGLELPPAPEPVDNVFRVYAKDPTRSMSFHDDRLSKQRKVSASVRTAAYRFAMPLYNELRSRGTVE